MGDRGGVCGRGDRGGVCGCGDRGGVRMWVIGVSVKVTV